jgi:hypothetical protein
MERERRTVGLFLGFTLFDNSIWELCITLAGTSIPASSALIRPFATHSAKVFLSGSGRLKWAPKTEVYHKRSVFLPKFKNHGFL